jgi:hypothetical protein
MKHLLAALALLGLLISATLHFSTYLGFDLLDSYPGAWLLHVALFVVFVPAFYLLRIRFDGLDVRPSSSAPTKFLSFLLATRVDGRQGDRRDRQPRGLAA